MSAEVDVVRRFRQAVRENDREVAAAVLAPEVEWELVGGKPLRGVDEVLDYYTRPGSGGPENLDVELEPGELEDVGGGRVSAVNHQVFRWKETGEFAYERRVRIDYTISGGKILSCTMTLLEEA